MPIEIVEISDSRVAVQLERIGPNARAALEEALAPLATQIGADARSRAAAHIHLIGKESLGAYVESIKDGVASKDARGRASLAEYRHAMVRQTCHEIGYLP